MIEQVDKLNWSKNMVFNKWSWKGVIFLFVYNKQKLIKKQNKQIFGAQQTQ